MTDETQRVAGVAAPPVEDERAASLAASAPTGGEHALSVAAHPRAARRVAESKAWSGIAGFVAGGYLSLANHTLAEAAFRALATGVVCYVAVWAAAVFVWRRLVVAELRDREHALLSGALARREAAAAGASAGGEPEQPGAAER